MTKATRLNYLTGAEGLVKLLDQHKVKYIFGLCGDTSLPFYDALYRLNHSIKHVLTRDERSASYMADAYARVTGKVGVCEGPSGGGATYIIPGIVEANESSISVISITSDVPTTSIGHFPLTELNQKELFKPLTKWNEILNNPKKLGYNIRKAFKMSTSGRPGACHLSFPFDVQTAEISGEDIWVNEKYCKFPSDSIKPDPKKIDLIAKEISKAKNPIIICGGAIKNSFAEKELKKLVEKLNIVLATSVTGKGTLEDVHPNSLGVVGSNGGSLYTREVLQRSDLVIFIGCRAGSVTTEKWQYPSSKSKIIHIDLSLIHIKKIKKNNFNGNKIVKAAKRKKFTEFNKLCKEEKGLIKPERIVKEINNAMPDNAYIVVDPGTPCPYFSAYYNFKKSGRYFITNRAHGALGYALPASIGVQIGKPKNKVVSVMGDGSFGFAVGELETAKRLKLPIIFVVISNSVYGWIKAGQKSSFNKRYYSVDFSRTDHAKVASSYGVKAWTVKKPNDLKKIISNAIKYEKGPCLIDIISQPLEEAKAPVSEWIA